MGLAAPGDKDADDLLIRGGRLDWSEFHADKADEKSVRRTESKLTCK